VSNHVGCHVSQIEEAGEQERPLRLARVRPAAAHIMLEGGW